ncbi:hypothetical protein M422DRAFT_227234 [Sphaerobolus stellatus SS14]|uniref:methylated diphthine methylhydrolase n=1 Tax=Sphaerobolus stellatus (strain SS14) TaxID=990650 RepID=A0A0C9VEY3_SPHS4|nr:hypothetical protein M422DRAFT_227234 [Sphaerobolus stellatus SS14]
MSHRVDTILPADSAEFCPAADATDIFVIGTYKLEESTPNQPAESEEEVQVPIKQQRWGKCLVYQTTEDDECVQLQEVLMPAIFDMKWAVDVLGIADAEGNLRFLKWDNKNRRLEEMHTLKCEEGPEDALCLSLDWCRYRSDYSSDKLTVSLSNGCVQIVEQTNATYTVTNTWKAHDFEPWITAWDRWDLNRIYTGGDDCVLKGWDSRIGFDQPIFKNKRFEGGVTTIQGNPHLEHIIAVGSYDTKVRLFDVRQLTRPVTEVEVGGGAWRVKWHPDPARSSHLLVACMHDGFKVVNFENISQGSADVTSSIASRFDKHESLAYGVDWSSATPTKEGTLVASCSFYDHSMYLWRA